MDSNRLKRWKRYIAILTAVVVACGLMGCGERDMSSTVGGSPGGSVNSQPETREAEGSREGETSFTDMVYEHYDTSDFYQMAEEVQEKMGDGENSEEVIALLDALADELYVIATCRGLAYIYNSLDASDEYYMEEYNYSENTFTEMDDALSSLAREVLQSPCGDAIREIWSEEDVDYYESYVDMTEEQAELFDREQALILEYNAASIEEYTVEVDGRKYTLSDLYEDDEMSWEEYVEAYQRLMKSENDVLGPIYVELVQVRNRIAASYGYDSYTDYCYEEVYGRGYTAEEAYALDKQVKELIAPLYDDLYTQYYYQYGAYNARLNDMVAQMPIEEQMEKVKTYLAQIDPVLEDNFSYMERNGLYDLEYSDRKMDAGYTIFLYSYETPFLYNQRGYSFYDMSSLVHEFGHFNSYLINAEEAATAYDLDLAEIHSQGLEILYTHFYKDMFGGRYGGVAADYTVLNLLDSVVSGCMYDEFQQRVYALEEPTLDEINDIYTELALANFYSYEEFGTSYEWMMVPHNYQDPLYYVSYAISALPTLELWELVVEDFDAASELYMELVRCGEGGGYEETLEESGLTSPFTEGYLERLEETLESYYELNEAA